MSKQLIKNYNRIPFKKGSLGFHKIPYHLQYENRDFNIKIIDNPTAKKEINRKKYVKEFNPYLRGNVSENLSQEVKDFYSKKYSQR